MRLRVVLLPALIFLVLIPALNIIKMVRSPFRVFRAPEQGFSVEFPWPWVPKITTEQAKGGVPMTEHVYQVDVGKMRSFQVRVVEFGPAAVPLPDAASYARFIQTVAGTAGAKIRTTYPYTIAGYPGLAAVLETEQRAWFDQLRVTYVTLLNVVQIRGRLYLLLSTGPFGHEVSPVATRFRDSFRLIGESKQTLRVPLQQYRQLLALIRAG